MSTRIEHSYEFSPFRIDAEERVLFCDGALVPLSPKAFDILLLLVERSGHLVEKSEIMDAVWPDTFVEEGNLTQNIFTLRKVLGKRESKHLFIETVAKRGYRFIAPVKTPEQEDSAPEIKGAQARPAPGDEHAASTSEEVVNSLAILPFINASADQNGEYLADGITESIINSLSQLSHLRVMARSTVFNYKGLKVNPREAGRELGVRAVLTGRILSYDERLIIRTELVDVTGGWAIWGAQYNRKSSDILEVQEEIAWEIAYNLRIKLTSKVQELLTRRYTEHTKAYRLYLMGRFFWNKYTREGVEKGIDYFQQAIEHDPNYALAYAGLADAYHRLSNLYLPPAEVLPKARAAAVKAVEIDDLLAEAHASFGLLKMYYDHDWEGAESEFKRAIELNPGNAMSHKRYGEYLMFTGRFNEAFEEYKLSLKFDPMSLQSNINLGTVLFLMGEYEQSVRQIKKAIELDPGYCPAHLTLGCSYLASGDLPNAVAEFELAWQLDNEAYSILGFLGYSYGAAGRRDEAAKVLKELLETSEKKYVSPYGIAITYLGLGEREKALFWLRKTYEERNDFLMWLNVGPELEALRSDTRFTGLLRRIGFTRLAPGKSRF
ncbi:MAG TPA: winged helix-turn-helix domain-containing protein [Pyrinomonadaceae bacterium]|jgi:TolB-like protein/Tfp pilus assembly protein PilF